MTRHIGTTLFVTASLIAPAFSQAPLAHTGKLSLSSATPNVRTVPRYGKLELTLDLAARYDNPFDPKQVDVWAVFTPPSGKPVRANAFLDQPFTRKLEQGKELIEPAGAPVWRLRFTPTVTGIWRYRVHARDRSGEKALPEATFRVIPSASPGFIRRSAKNPQAFSYDNGRPYFAVGENMGWGGERGSFQYDDWLAPLSAAGGNWIRVWMCSWNCGLEWNASESGFHGLGGYNLANAWKLDRVLDAARHNNVKVMLCFGTFGELSTGGYFNEGQWAANPYNTKNGGPCATPADFWKDATARKLYRQRLRYLMARYAWDPGIQAWEFWNEANPTAPWIAEMASFLKGTGAYKGNPADPYRHLVTTTYGNDAVWKVPGIDFTQTHSYGTGNIPDHAPVVHADALEHAKYHKPHLMGEFGIDYRTPDATYDPKGKAVNFHNGLWASAASGNAGGAMLWWWDNYVHPKNLYGVFRPLRLFADKVPWTAGPWTPLEADRAIAPGAAATYRDLVIPARGTWGRNSQTEFDLSPMGPPEDAVIPHFLYSPGKADLRTAPIFRVDLPHPARFIAHFDELSNSATVRILLDGQPAGEVKLSAAPPADPAAKPDYVKTEFKKEYGIYQAQLDRDLGIDVPAGKHAITLEVTDGDWIGLGSVTVTGFMDNRYPSVNLYGMRSKAATVLWAQNAGHTWKAVHDGTAIPTIRGARTVLHGIPPGRRTVEWWDTWKGAVTKRESVLCRNGDLPLALPDLATDIAAIIR